MHRGGAKGCNPAPIRESIQDSGYELRRIPLLGTSVNRGKKRKGRGCVENPGSATFR